MKRVFSTILSFIMLCSFNTATVAASVETNGESTSVFLLAESNSTVINEYKHFTPFTINNEEIRLYSVPLMTAEDALNTYADAFEICADAAKTYNITASLENTDFVEFAKVYAAMNENGSAALIKECKEFAVYLDHYENIEINENILNAISSNSRNSDREYIVSLMPKESHSTAPSGETVFKEETHKGTRGEYNTGAVVTYASTWWNKTNNDDYSYYAEYNDVDASRNDYNSLDVGRSGQSNPARSWSDCANFVSQCLAAGGVPQIKSGLLLPHRKTSNWYYSDSKPSHTWGGANNFYDHWRERVGVATISSALGVGDAVSIDFGGDGSPDHTVIIVSAGSTDSSKYLASHTTDRYMYYYSNGSLYSFNLTYLYGNGWTLYGYEIDKAF